MLPILIRDYGAEKIIVFGSFVGSARHPWSDLDIAIVKQTDKRFLDRTLQASRLVKSSVATDFLVYTPDEFAQMAKDNYFVRDEIVNKGKLLYDQNTSI